MENCNLNSDKVICVKENGAEYIKFKGLERFDNLECLFTLKPLDFKVKDGKMDVALESYNKLFKALNLSLKNLIVPKQTHTNTVKILEDEEGIYDKNLCEVDGIITNKKNKVLSLTFADCTPIALFDSKNNVIGNIHSGWKGTLNSIVKVAIEKMINDFHSNKEDIICVIGPTIRKCHFEVEDDVRSLFYEKYKYLDNISQIITLGRVVDGVQKYNIDTVLLNKTIMKNLGIKDENIIDSNICTVCNSKCCHSYRVEKEDAGRATLIMYLK